MKTIKEAKESGSIDENLTLLNAYPDVVHVGQKLDRSLANWWLWLVSCRFNLAILCFLRNDAGTPRSKTTDEKAVTSPTILLSCATCPYGAQFLNARPNN